MFFLLQQISRSRIRKNKLQAKQKENEESNSQTTSETSNNENQSNQSQKNSQDQATTEENTNDEQQVTRDNMFDYAIAAVNEVGDADLLKFQEPEYNGSEWTINANNKSGAGANTIVVKDDGTVQIWNGPKTSMNHETKIEL
ncbi:Uncharacterised protein [Staphylococcus aureus]|uniref:Uncharacterized protein n=1 Tax=Staphylococcus aureus TaxID=1280 RepID=A0A6H4CV60_STAAU|nr:hypothetical protein T665_02800 [Staphylococcus aureus SJOS6053]EVC41401.1 hypothetical protein T674_02860 [Staphylococcus aureus SJOS6072]EVD82097.1 hypothetical protein T750_02859 [Staphylococcus aureus FVRH6002]EVE65121.1 hypothetical protein T780_02870 [Staphylococcus aureus LAMC0011]EVF45592.1 hypothetical protein T831_02790 [Staphylococcus aureus UCIM6042]EVI50337.1 hypothetical protein T983_02874 [Staphylococcus aureus WAMC6102]EVJ75183.1 hypothetical protein U061_02863 [Staphylococ